MRHPVAKVSRHGCNDAGCKRPSGKIVAQRDAIQIIRFDELSNDEELPSKLIDAERVYNIRMIAQADPRLRFRAEALSNSWVRLSLRGFEDAPIASFALLNGVDKTQATLHRAENEPLATNNIAGTVDAIG